MDKSFQNKAKPNSDIKKVQQILKGFDQEKSEAVIYLKQKYGDLKQYEYLQIAEYCASKISLLTLDRESKRRKEVLLKWYRHNFYILKPILDNIVVENEDHNFFGEKANILKNEIISQNDILGGKLNFQNSIQKGDPNSQKDIVKEEIITQDETEKSRFTG